MIRSQKAPGRPVHNFSLAAETTSTSTNVPDITSYIGRVLTINNRQVLVEDILGQGGFAFVFLVRAFNQQRYALKRMYVNNQRDLHVCQREIAFVKEFSSHPNIVKYVDSVIHPSSTSANMQRRYHPSGASDDDGDDDNTIYEILLLTEYCSNGALITRLNEQRSVGVKLSEQQILRIFADICNAVSACHFRRPQAILHRDIKLENILIDSQQHHVLCDFGSSILLSSSSTSPNHFQQYQSNQLTTSIIQQLEENIQRYTTLAYRSPEMVDLYSRVPITLKADIWAMGCLLYKLMYNTMPFGESILAIQNGTFVIPDDMVQAYSRNINLLVRYMLETDVDKRPDIWQVSYVTYKLLSVECPIVNRCQSKIPDLNAVSMPLTESEFRQQRTSALSKVKSSSTNVIDESLSVGTAVNPRERPRGIMAPSTSLMSFSQRPTATTLPPPTPNSSNPSRSGSAAQLMFDDDFSQIPSHAISLNSIPNEPNSSRARPSPPATISTASGLTLQHQFFPPPPSSSNTHGHRRSSSQTILPTNTQSPFHDASSIDLATSPEKESSHFRVISDDDPTSDDEKPRSLENQHKAYASKSTNHRQSMEEAKKSISSNLSVEYPFDREKNLDNDDDQTTNATVQHSSDKSNPFLRAPFHHSPANNKQASLHTSTATNVSSFDPNSIVIGKRSSAFTRYQKEEIHSGNDTTTESLSAVDVFANAPFKVKSKSKQRSTTTKHVNDREKGNQKMIDDIKPQPIAYGRLSFDDTIVDEYV